MGEAKEEDEDEDEEVGVVDAGAAMTKTIDVAHNKLVRCQLVTSRALCLLLPASLNQY
jgi:hypothetical protein